MTTASVTPEQSLKMLRVAGLVVSHIAAGHDEDIAVRIVANALSIRPATVVHCLIYAQEGKS